MKPQRHLPLYGTRNFRDLGGYATTDGRQLVWGKVFRADRLTDLNAADVHELVQKRGIRTVIDLRTSAEVARYGPGLIAPHVERLHLSLLNPSLRLGLSLDYADWAEAAQDTLSRIFARMTDAQTPFPMVFHCSVGKDRTGILAALLLSALGVPEATIIEDYALTRKYFDPDDEQMGKWRRRVLKHFPGRVSNQAAQRLLDADPTTMKRFLDTIAQRHGSVQAFLDRLKIDTACLHTRLLEPM